MTLHLIPDEAGQFVHEPSDLCPCGPTVESVQHDGSYRWAHVHHGPDGGAPGADQ